MFAGLLGAFILGWLLRHLFFGYNQLALLQEGNKNLKYEHDFEISKKNANYSSLENKDFDLKYRFNKANEEVGEANKKVEALSSALEAEKLKPPIEKIVEVPKEIIVVNFEKINKLKSELDLHKQMLEEERSKPPKEVIVERSYDNMGTNNIHADLVQPYSVFFSPDEKGYALGGILKNYLDRAETFLSHHPEKKLLVIGYTDNIGGIEENRLLSEKRASFIKNELSLLGIDADRIETLGRGMMDPLGDNESEEGRSKNRRASIHII